MKNITLTKGRHTYRVSYERSDEAAVQDYLVSLVPEHLDILDVYAMTAGIRRDIDRDLRAFSSAGEPATHRAARASTSKGRP